MTAIATAFCHTPAAALRVNSSLQELGLADNFLDTSAVSELATSIMHTLTLRSLNLSGSYTSSAPPGSGAPSHSGRNQVCERRQRRWPGHYTHSCAPDAE